MTQMQELVRRVTAQLTEPWRKPTGRPKSCDLYHAVQIACMYLRQNCSQEFLGDLWNVSQPTVSRIITTLVPIVQTVLEEFVPTVAEAIEVVNGRVCLVDGTLAPCWSYADHHELWSGTCGTTGFTVHVVGLLNGEAVYISDPLPGSTHDATAFSATPAEEIVQKSGGGIGDKVIRGVAWPPHGKLHQAASSVPRDKDNNAAISTLRASIRTSYCGPTAVPVGRCS